MKNILIGVIVLIVLVSVGANAYFFGYKAWENKMVKKGFDLAIAQAVQLVKEKGQVKIGGYTLAPVPGTAGPTK